MDARLPTASADPIVDELSPVRLMAAYASGYYAEGDADDASLPIEWKRPEQRAVLDRFGRRHRRFLRRARGYAHEMGYEKRIDYAFTDVVDACAKPRAPGESTWLSPRMHAAYLALHRSGFAHSVEVWSEDELVGGALIVCLGRAIFCESMFHSRAHGGNTAVVFLSELCDEWNCELCDVQELSDHTRLVGGIAIAADEYDVLLRAALRPSPTNPVSEVT